ncbi:hypothetical protein [Salinicola endophyticus]|uniref:hypothetical protein n=1 Tax=Salinicola endophyticus TaxID=1949083 RepID=UPI000DA1BDB2|nr:hypothetical protein [Salinicola endophyticus]
MPKLKRQIISIEGFADGLLPFLNYFLVTTTAMSGSLLMIALVPNRIVIAPASLILLFALMGMLINNYRFVKMIFPNPPPEVLKPYLEAKGPKSPGWFMGIYRELKKEPRYVLTVIATLAITEILLAAGFISMATQIKTAL